MTTAVAVYTGTSQKESSIFGSFSDASFINNPQRNYSKHTRRAGVRVFSARAVTFSDENFVTAKSINCDIVERLKLIKVNNFLSSFKISNEVILENKVRAFLMNNSFLIKTLEKLTSQVFSSEGISVKQAVLQILENIEGYEDNLYLEFYLAEGVSLKRKIEIDDYFKIQNTWYLSNNLLKFDFV